MRNVFFIIIIYTIVYYYLYYYCGQFELCVLFILYNIFCQ